MTLMSVHIFGILQNKHYAKCNQTGAKYTPTLYSKIMSRMSFVQI